MFRTNLQAGFAGDDAPKAVFASLVGRPRHQVLYNIYIAELHREMAKLFVLSASEKKDRPTYIPF